MTELKSFYSDLYREMIGMPTAEIDQIFLRNDDIPKLSEIDKEICEGELTMNECLQALKPFDCNKSPGNDGLTAELVTLRKTASRLSQLLSHTWPTFKLTTSSCHKAY